MLNAITGMPAFVASQIVLLNALSSQMMAANSVDLVGDRGLDDVVFGRLIVVRVLDVQIDVHLLGRVVGALEQRIEKFTPGDV